MRNSVTKGSGGAVALGLSASAYLRVRVPACVVVWGVYKPPNPLTP